MSMWRPLLSPAEVVFRSAAIYVFIQLLFRVTGRKEFARWGPSDIVLLFLVSVGARTSMVGNDSSLTSAMIALSTIVALDWAFSMLTARSEWAARLLEGDPRPLIRDGAVQPRELRRTRISESQILARVREQGRHSLAQVKDAYLERDGKISLVFREQT